MVLTFQTNMVCFCKNASNYFLSNRFFLFPKILFLIKSWKIKKANPESIFNIMIFVTTFVFYTYWNLARKPHLRQVILALVFVQFVYTFCTLFFCGLNYRAISPKNILRTHIFSPLIYNISMHKHLYKTASKSDEKWGRETLSKLRKV